jgi:hypothetical protein
MQLFSNWVGGVMGFVVRTLLFVAGLVFMLSLMVASTLGLGAMLLWRLLTGKRPVVPRFADLGTVRGFSIDPRGGWQRFQTGGSPFGSPSGEVIDAEVREVPEPPGTLK